LWARPDALSDLFVWLIAMIDERKTANALIDAGLVMRSRLIVSQFQLAKTAFMGTNLRFSKV
jgi:hypothetical protein